MNKSVGILEVYGLTTAFVAADAGCKAANVSLEDFDRNKPANAENLPVPLLVTVKFRGTVENVTAAVDAAETTALLYGGVSIKHIIANPTEGTAAMLTLSGFDK